MKKNLLGLVLLFSVSCFSQSFSNGPVFTLTKNYDIVKGVLSGKWDSLTNVKVLTNVTLKLDTVNKLFTVQFSKNYTEKYYYHSVTRSINTQGQVSDLFIMKKSEATGKENFNMPTLIILSKPDTKKVFEIYCSTNERPRNFSVK